MNSRYRVNLRLLQEAAEHAAGKENIQVQVQEYNQLLRKQIDLLNHYCTIKYEELLLEIQNVAKHIRRVTQIASEGNDLISEKELSIILLSSERQLTAAGEDVVALELCIRENFQLLIKSIINFDNIVMTSAAPWFIAQLTREGFANVNSDQLLIALSLCWEKWRLLESRDWMDKNNENAWKPPESFVRNTIKYWIRPDKVCKCKASIVRYLPYLIFGLSIKELSYILDPYEIESEKPKQEVCDSQLVSSVYFDSDKGYSYQRRIQRMEKAELIRFRWYGENAQTVHDKAIPIFVERKTHHESWSGQDSVKERFSLPQKKIYDYIRGQLDLDQWVQHLDPESKKTKNILKLGKEISKSIQQRDLQPMLRTSYLRSAFQRSDRNDIRFSLDTNLCMVDEYNPELWDKMGPVDEGEELPPKGVPSKVSDDDFDGHNPGDGRNPGGDRRAVVGNMAERGRGGKYRPWCKTDHEILSGNQVVRFPYAVLEVKLQTEQPQWVSKMLYDCGATMVYKFSKFQHGFAFLHRNMLPPDVPLPHWIEDFENRGYVQGFQLPSVGTNQLSMSQGRRGLLSGTIPGALRLRDGGMNDSFYVNTVYSRGRNVKKYDPKSIFACERTLMHYCRKALFVFAAGLAAFQKGWNASGIAAIVSGMACVIYSFLVYKTRMHKIVK
ncbi:VTC domain protein [Gregarina niphandrodes]|uniref:VTC domain protein n=1 Tax=Gregarina niphandrodes TaxID=110365 RepID=A0A023B125_GRENI|nr:VTC domain protein [Gregarina niphandrodes]EZG46117.1 VTC domain protein [Gregarina niphandrodes]|eukprot:XP_011132373.1 VTC domain protein [Gregarina niphandrodes]